MNKSPRIDFRLRGTNLAEITNASVREAFRKPYKSDRTQFHAETAEVADIESVAIKMAISDGHAHYMIRGNIHRHDLENDEHPATVFIKILAHTAAWMNWHLYTEVLCWAPPMPGSDQYELPLLGQPQHPTMAGLRTFTESHARRSLV